MGLIRRWNEPDDPRDLGPSGNAAAERSRMLHNIDDLEDEVERLTDQLRGAVSENERLRAALKQCQNTDDAEVYRWAGNALAGLHWTGSSPGGQCE
jgi:hypothetical protein